MTVARFANFHWCIQHPLKRKHNRNCTFVQNGSKYLLVAASTHYHVYQIHCYAYIEKQDVHTHFSTQGHLLLEKLPLVTYTMRLWTCKVLKTNCMCMSHVMNKCNIAYAVLQTQLYLTSYVHTCDGVKTYFVWMIESQNYASLCEFVVVHQFPKYL